MYKKDTKDVYNTWDNVRQVWEKYTVINRKREGIYEERRGSDNSLYRIGTYVNGKKHGEWKTWYPSKDGNPGQLCCLSNYKNDILHGPFKRWHSNGMLQYDIMYVDGKKQID